MRRISMVVALLLLAVLLPQSGQAVGEGATPIQSETAADVECIVVALNMANSNESQVKTAAIMAFLYYVGRIDGREPAFELYSAVVDEVHRTEGKPREASARCGKTLQTRGNEISALGEKLQSLAAEEGKAKAAGVQ